MQKDADTNSHSASEQEAFPLFVAAAALDHQADLVLAGRGTLPQFGGRLRTTSIRLFAM